MTADREVTARVTLLESVDVDRIETMADLAVLYDEHRHAMVRLAHLLTGSLAIAEEVVQDAFVTLFAHRTTIDHPPGYLRKVVVNGSYGRSRRAGIETSKLELVHRQRTGDTWEPPAEIDEIWVALHQLRPRQRAALVLRFYEDLPIAAIAELMDTRPGTVKSLIHRGINQLREVLQP